jgi:hypothetical protein
VWIVIESEAFASIHTWHDFRATLATALAAADKSTAYIQAAVCWASPASVALYEQLKPEALADAADVATSVDASRHAHIEVPHICDDTVIDELEACLHHMDSGKPAGKARQEAVAQLEIKAVSKGKAKLAPATQTPSAPVLKPKVPQKRRRPPSPAPSPSVKTFMVGAPLNQVTIHHPHKLDGSRIAIHNSMWAARDGTTRCTVEGFAPGAHLRGHTGVFVVTADDDALHYAFTPLDLCPFLPTTQEQPHAPPPQRRPRAPPASPQLQAGAAQPRTPHAASCSAPTDPSPRRSPRLAPLT